ERAHVVVNGLFLLVHVIYSFVVCVHWWSPSPPWGTTPYYSIGVSLRPALGDRPLFIGSGCRPAPRGFHSQQDDPADERDGSGDRRDKVAVGGFNVHTEELDRLCRRLEVDARVGKHHDAENDQDDRGDVFCVHNVSPFFHWVRSTEG